MQTEKMYVRRDHKCRVPVNRGWFIDTWVEMVGLDERRAEDWFDEAVAYGDIVEHIPVLPTLVIGCICPPTSEVTCQNPMCPRAPFPDTAVSRFGPDSLLGVNSIPTNWHNHNV